MKTNSLFTIVAAAAAIIAFVHAADAQNTSPYWSLQGNSNATNTSKLGTTNAQPLRLFTNNQVRLFIDKSNGNVSINNGSSANSSYKLYVKGVGYGGIYGTGTYYGIVGSGGSYGVYGDGATAGLYGNSYNGFGGYAVSYNGDGFDAATTYGYYGIYASCPDYYGIYGYGGSIGSYGSGGTYGVYGYGGNYGIAGSTNSGFGAYGSSSTGVGGYFRSINGYGVEAKSDNNYYAGVFWGHVYSSGGYVTSDRNLKKNIQDVGSAMSIINKLKPKFYEFKDDAQYASLQLPKGKHYGLLAQDIEEVLPNLVHQEKFQIPNDPEPVIVKPKDKDGKDINNHQKIAPAEKQETIDIKAVNYDELIPIMIKAMQEQNDKIEELTRQLAALTTGRQPATGNNTAAIKLSNAYLGQSIPNPAKNSTTIYYHNLPSSARAQLVVYDANGKMVKQIQVSGGGNGSVNLDVSGLSSGRYTYSLLINGKLAETKTMEVAR